MKVPENIILVRGGIAEVIKGDILILDVDNQTDPDTIHRHLDCDEEAIELTAMYAAKSPNLITLIQSLCLKPLKVATVMADFDLYFQVCCAWDVALQLGVGDIEEESNCMADAVGIMVREDVLPTLSETYKLLFPCQ